ncbi:glycoside hydrolase family 3 C-terminal domain-containing protein [Leifsonia sp. TF02-11]|uniref:glycoside hydrolase family 3 C-terminal domain-containing protein n=1 Tax=Leifsonia sp. TF02-11 TaxID=2815212 RepID=UPI001AA1B5A1|nr:glycoside hydrolase family 3 C-terminal domain-containing protein [Leifsonia sp. TF02-11]MBO1737880.1 glycoside hydrolase family 3 C-terminal domain-containing protein [Leifsonia sp. TF02-11]
MVDRLTRASELTVEEKASLTSGRSFWETEPVDRVGIPSLYLTDGPHGVRKQAQGGDHLGIGDSVPATCFPPAVALGSSWDAELLERVGAALGEEAKAEGVGVLLGPGINIKRSPLCGRNFEYLSEDPIVSGRLGAALVRGLQSQGVGASLKHFAANNQETDRLRVSADVDERPLREIYLRGFQHVVEQAQPWTVMCSYNRINGVYASEDPWLLTSVLRDEWGFDGLVVSDWGAVNDRVSALVAGLDLEMPSTGGVTDAQLVAAVRDGSLAESVLDTAANRVIELVEKALAGADADATYDVDAHHALAREVAGRSIVLLKNDGVLPLSTAAGRSIAVVGEFARTPRYQGAGSSQIVPTRLDNALDEVIALAGDATVAFAPGYVLGESADADAVALTAEAVGIAAAADDVLVFLGLPGEDESEGFDREHLELPAAQTALLEAVIAANPRVTVVLSNGGVVRVSGWSDRVPAIVEGWLLGQAGGGAIADVLFGVVNPSGRLAESIPVRIEDTASFLNFPGEKGHVRYGEGLFVGYRDFDARGAAVSFPFGHGLSYTTFAFGAPTAAPTADGGIRVTVDVTNTGARDGREVVQVYVSVPSSRVQRPVRELKGFAAVAIAAGATETVVVELPASDLAYYDTELGGWSVEAGDYVVEVGASSRDLRGSVTVSLAGDGRTAPLSVDSTLGEWLEHPVGGPILMAALAQSAEAEGMGAMLADPSLRRMAESIPLIRAAAFPGSPVTHDQLDQLVAAANA